MSTMNRSLRPGALVAALLALTTAPIAAQATACPDATAITRGFSGPLATVRYLADDALEGREVGSHGARCAADYIAARFQALGLQPGDSGSWFQPFPVRKGAALGPSNSMEISTRTYAVGSEWVPFGFSASGAVAAPAVYGGHGVSRPNDPDDRYAHVDVDGKIVVVEWGDPEAGSGGGMRADPHFKATVALGRNAVGMIVLLPDGMALPTPDEELRNALAIPVVAVSGEVAVSVRAAAQTGATVHVRTDVQPTTTEARNVLAVLPGSDPALRDQYIVVGAHFDHLGMGGEGSLDPDARAVHNGADDNASGVAGVLDIAERLSHGPRPARSVLFIAFTGEEKGLWGSAHFVADPTIDLTKAVAMLNLDMVGRLVDNTVTVFGTGTAVEWESVADDVDATLGQPLKLAFSPDGYGPSDHASFTAVGVPVLHFFTNTHEDYHRATDDWQKIDGDGIDRIAQLAAGITHHLAGGGDAVAMTLTPVKQEPPAPPAGGEASRGYGPYFGSIPDMTPRDYGLRLTGVREGSPAAKAGLKAGDVVVEFDGKPIADIYAYTYALRDKKPGDVVKVVVERDGKRVTMTAVLEERR
jgi:aminopeptidase YwaD